MVLSQSKYKRIQKIYFLMILETTFYSTYEIKRKRIMCLEDCEAKMVR